MYQIDGPDTVAAKPGKKPAATQPGWFDGGDPTANKKATMVTRDWLNTVQAELKNAIEGAGITLDRTKDDQLHLAIKGLVSSIATTIVNQAIEAIPPPVIPPAPEVPSPVPVGTIIHFYGTSAPAGYLPCNGTAFSSTGYPKLYALLGSAVTPNLAGCFLRMTGSQSAALGVIQQDAGRNVTGVLHLMRGFQNVPSQNEAGNAITFTDNAGGSYNRLANADKAGHGSAELYINASKCWNAAHTANEFRPLNAAVLFCIKHD
jgi:hypothetical protein